MDTARPTRTSAKASTGTRGRPAKELKQERAVRTRGVVLAAAAQAFADRGFPPVTVQDVAELAGMTKGAVYFHFANKEALAQAVANDFYTYLDSIATAVKAEALSPVSTVQQLLMRTARAFRDNVTIQAGARLQIERAYIGIDIPVPYVGHQSMVTAALREAVEAGEVPAGTDPEVLARVIVSAFFGAQHISGVLNDRQDITERVEEILATVLPMAPAPARD
ncbi:ScbR family autoregulator-binding transcription factor (plasmid) [Streptomyces sp. HUAS MG91]|uniref:ScbR family autoregulator-binding transcription factor n=1 Tax=Streptomyces tabacisoli TaxID=3156398 RepID=A0AAU8J7H8_9ACTN